MTKSNLTIRIEPALKKEASDLFQSLGLDLSTQQECFIFKHCAVMDCHFL